MDNKTDTINITDFSTKDLQEFNKLKNLHNFVSKQKIQIIDNFGNEISNYDILTIHIGIIRNKISKILIKYNNQL
jgi:hypothetical protein